MSMTMRPRQPATALINTRWIEGAASVATLVAGLSVVPAQAEDVKTIDMTITDKGCEPISLAVPPGRSVFKIRNASRRATEWEILKGVNVVEERENIIPGFVQNLTATLDAGDYEMTCGLLSNPKGTLVVSAAAGAAAQVQPVSAMDLVGPLSEYKVYVTQEVEALVQKTRGFVEAIRAGDLDRARAIYAPTRQHYERIEPVAELFNDLDGSIDTREDDFAKKAEDPAFMGFHRLEKALFADRTTQGQAATADKLLADVTELQSRVAALTITPKSMVGGAAGLIEEVAATKISGEEDRYSRTDLWDFQANVDGAHKIFTLLKPLVARQKPELDARVADNFSKVNEILAKYRDGEGVFASYDQLSDADRGRLKGPVTVLAEDLSQLRGTLGVD